MGGGSLRYLSLAPGTDGPHGGDAPPFGQSEGAQLLHRHFHGNPTKLGDEGLGEGRDRAVHLGPGVVPGGPDGDGTNVALTHADVSHTRGWFSPV